jgi:hypothetical protein
MTVSERDIEYMQRLGRFQEEGRRERMSRHASLSPEERLSRSLEMSQAYLGQARVKFPNDDPTPFYDRARQLGLYRP